MMLILRKYFTSNRYETKMPHLFQIDADNAALTAQLMVVCLLVKDFKHHILINKFRWSSNVTVDRHMT